MASGNGGKETKIKKVVIEQSKCVGCVSCVTTCAMKHTGRFSISEGRLFIEKHDVKCLHFPRICLQCEEAYCRDACPMEAITDNGNGILVVDQTLCSGCGLCEQACPDKGIRVTKMPDGRSVATKCDQCNGENWCAKVCVTGALRFE